MGNPKIWNWSPKQLKNATWAFYQTHDMQHFTYHVGNAWTCENLPKYKLKFPHEANTETNTPNGIEPNQEIEKNFAKNIVPNPFSKNPQFK